ncbi:hypothetical protein BsIDN1_01170 [Bacillus safensis]|uniref:RNA-binding S4 domain-containing protein n=1 Tax=Bacillus safensis TaxID=561879 RepID=A0A5S9M3P1_BACIA|nr:hypothetical protein BsIDN1_01170 [Bacillus safensis]
MRLDKFLKVSRLIKKRRTLAKEVADQGRISINGTQAKASSDVKEGDELQIRFGQKKLVTVQVNELKDTKKKRRSGWHVYCAKKKKKQQNRACSK